MAKLVVCKRCGEAGLMWRQSKKGGWYLTHPDPATVRGESGRVIKSFYPAHRCAEQDPQQAAYEGAERHLEQLENAYIARMTGTHPD